MWTGFVMQHAAQALEAVICFCAGYGAKALTDRYGPVVRRKG